LNSIILSKGGFIHMLIKRSSGERGPTDTGWLKSLHSFSFGSYHDPAHMGFGPLRVINEDRVAPGAGFDMHAHNNMEIISYVLSGELAHKDSMGNGSAIRPGDVQLMSAGSGVSHSEYNNSKTDPVHFLQIWVTPDVRNAEPRYQQKSFNDDQKRNAFRVIVSPEGTDGSLSIRQDARMLIGRFDADGTAEMETAPGRKYWLQVVQGTAEINGQEARAGDGFAFEEEASVRVRSVTESEIVLFDLP
jgi:quercetin 2,3-dioxygenase